MVRTPEEVLRREFRYVINQIWSTARGQWRYQLIAKTGSVGMVLDSGWYDTREQITDRICHVLRSLTSEGR